MFLSLNIIDKVQDLKVVDVGKVNKIVSPEPDPKYEELESKCTIEEILTLIAGFRKFAINPKQSNA